VSNGKTLTRQELYERVWKEPMTKVAAEFGLSDRGLAKIRAYDYLSDPRPARNKNNVRTFILFAGLSFGELAGHADGVEAAFIFRAEIRLSSHLAPSGDQCLLGSPWNSVSAEMISQCPRLQ
jgi:hypothetical protein